MTLIDLFCGAGGMSCGLEMAGFTPVLANELDEIFAHTYKANNPGAVTIQGDVRRIDSAMICSLIKKYDTIDLIAGGPPCQGYSLIAPSRSLDDPRNWLFNEYIRIVESVKPKAVIIENVPGIISFEKGYIVSKIYNSLTSLGYHVDHKILCAAHYGIPQMRFRTFFIGIRNHAGEISFPPPTHAAKVAKNFTKSRELCIEPKPLLGQDLKPQIGVWDAIGDLPPISDAERCGDYEYPSSPATPYQKFARQNSAKITSHYCAKLSSINRERLRHIPQGGSWRDIPFELLPAGLKRAARSDHTQRYGRLSPAGLCSTIQTKCDPHWGCFFHPTQERVISVREAARLQSFPDRFIFTGNLTQQYKQIGNAVPPLMALAVGRQVKAMLEAAAA